MSTGRSALEEYTADMNYPRIPLDIAEQVRRIELSHDPIIPPGIPHCPCRVITRNGLSHDCVYMASEKAFSALIGFQPQEDARLSITDVREVQESSSRLPARFADQLYAAGESGMGYYIFRVVFADGQSQVYYTGGAVDFIPYPPGQSSRTVVRVEVSTGWNDPSKQAGCDYFWCFYSE